MFRKLTACLLSSILLAGTARADSPQGLPIEVMRKLAEPDKQSPLPFEPDAATRLDRIRARYTAMYQSKLARTDSSDRLTPVIVARHFEGTTFENPYFKVYKQLREDAGKNGMRLRRSLREPITDQKLQKQFAEALARVDITKLVDQDVSDSQVDVVNKYMEVLSVKDAMTILTLAYEGGTWVYEKYKDGQEQAKAEDARRVQLDYFRQLQEDVGVLGDKLEVLGTQVDGIGQSVDRVDRNTVAVLITQHAHLKYTVATLREMQAQIDSVQVVQEDTLVTVKAGFHEVRKELLQQKAISQATLNKTIENGLKLDLVASGIYESLPSADARVRFLNHPAFNISGKEAELTRQTRLRVAERLDDYFAASNQLINGLGQLGCDPEFVKVASTAVAKGAQANQVFKSAVKGDWLGAVAGVLGLAFGGGPSAEELRHQEVMDAFRQVMESQQKIYDKLLNIEKQIRELRVELVEVKEAIREVGTQVQDVHALLREMADKDALLLDDFLKQLSAEADYDGECKHFNLAGNPEMFNRGWQELQARFQFATSNGMSAPLSEKHLLKAADGDKASQYLTEYVAPHYQLLRDMKWQPRDFGQLSLSSQTVRDIERRTKEMIQGQREIIQGQREIIQGQREIPVEHFNSFVKAHVVERDVRLLIQAANYRFLQASDASPSKGLMTLVQLQDANALNDLKQRRKEILNVLANALSVVETATAQQTMLSGDLLLPVLYADPDSAVARQILRSNQLLRGNFGLYLADQSGINSIQYASLYNFQDPVHWSPINNAWKTKWPGVKSCWFLRDTDGWGAILPNGKNEDWVRVPLPLPSAEALGEFEWSSALHRMHALRAELVDAIIQIEFCSSISIEDERLLVQLFARSGR